jgi:hypothetical protein
MRIAIIARMIALVKPSRSPSLPVPKVKRGIVGVLAHVSIGQRRQQERAGVGAHVQAVGNERD